MSHEPLIVIIVTFQTQLTLECRALRVGLLPTLTHRGQVVWTKDRKPASSEPLTFREPGVLIERRIDIFPFELRRGDEKESRHRLCNAAVAVLAFHRFPFHHQSAIKASPSRQLGKSVSLRE